MVINSLYSFIFKFCKHENTKQTLIQLISQLKFLLAWFNFESLVNWKILTPLMVIWVEFTLRYFTLHLVIELRYMQPWTVMPMRVTLIWHLLKEWEWGLCWDYVELWSNSWSLESWSWLVHIYSELNQFPFHTMVQACNAYLYFFSSIMWMSTV